MSTFAVFFDDSGTHRESEVAVAACVISDARRWRDFCVDWNRARNDAYDGFDAFHMADCVSRRAAFEDWSETKVGRVIDRLMDIIEANTLAVSVSAVVKSDYDRMITGPLKEKLGSRPYTFAVQSCLAHVGEWKAANGFASGSVRYVFDRMSKGRGELMALMQDLLLHGLAPSFGLEPGGFAFEDRWKELPLQSADILAWNGYRYMRDCQLPSLRGAREGSPHPSFMRLVNQVPRQVDLYTRYYDENSLSEVARSLSDEYDRIGWANSPRGGLF